MSKALLCDLYMASENACIFYDTITGEYTVNEKKAGVWEERGTFQNQASAYHLYANIIKTH